MRGGHRREGEDLAVQFQVRDEVSTIHAALKRLGYYSGDALVSIVFAHHAVTDEVDGPAAKVVLNLFRQDLGPFLDRGRPWDSRDEDLVAIGLEGFLDALPVMDDGQRWYTERLDLPDPHRVEPQQPVTEDDGMLGCPV